MTIADHPLHRSGLALLTHPALALGGNAQASDFLWSFIIVLCLSASRHALGLFAQRTPGSPGSRADCVRTCMGPLTAPSTSLAHQIASNIIAFPIPLQGRHPSFFFFSRLNTQPARSPVNASTTLSRAPPHDSGPSYLVRTSMSETCILNNLPVDPGAQESKQ